MIVTKRVYEPYDPSDGFRVLIDRLWPRGLSKERAHIDLWARDIAPSNELRQWYQHDPDKWTEFRKRYASEIRTTAAKELLDELVRRGKRGRVTLVYSSNAGEISNAAALLQMLNRRLKRVASAASSRQRKPS